MTLRAVKPQHETRTRILDAAEELFMQHGFEGTSMRLLTAKAGVNLAAVNYHFGSKDAMVEAVFRRRLDQRVLRAEVVVDGGEVDTCLGGEQAHRGAFEAVLHEELFGGIENTGAGFVLGLYGAQGHDGIRVQTNV